MIVLHLILLFVTLGSCLFALFLIIKGVRLVCTKKILSGISHLAIGLPLLLPMVILVIGPATVAHFNDMRLWRCRDNLRQFGGAFKQYSREHQGFSPTSFLQVTNYLEKGHLIRHVVLENGRAEEQLLNPLQASLDYILVTNVTSGSDPFEVQAYCFPAHHHNFCCSVLFANGEVRTIKKQHFDKPFMRRPETFKD